MVDFQKVAEETLPVLTRLRRDAAINLMKAHDIPIPVFERDGRVIPPTKSQLMPTLETHMTMGTFKKAPKYPQYLLSGADRAQFRKTENYIKFRGPKGGRWCIMKGDEVVVSGFTTKESAQEGLDSGTHISTGSKQDS